MTAVEYQRMIVSIFSVMWFSPTLAEISMKECITGGFSSVPGDCKKLSECPSALSNLRAGIDPIPCYEQDGYPYVCCEKERISEAKCRKYEAQARSLILGDTENGNSTKMCYKIPDSSSKRKVEYMDLMSFTVAIGYNIENRLSWRCSGTLISNQFVLTAASCINLKYEQEPPTTVFLGGRSLGSSFIGAEVHPDAWGRVQMGIAEIFLHPDYFPPTVYKDIALIRLEEEVKFSGNIQPACLPRPKGRPELADQFLVAGWSGLHLNGGSFDQPLEVVEAIKFSRKDCSLVIKLLHGYSAELPDGIVKSQICAGALSSDYDDDDTEPFCVGDQGGPLAITKGPSNCIQYVVGVTSYGTELCRYGEMPVVYTNVQSYLDWIESVVWPEEDNLSEVDIVV